MISEGKNQPTARSRIGRLVLFFVLVVLLTIPFWVIGTVTGLELLPGLPVAALSAFCPMAAALILAYRDNGASSVIALLMRSFDFGHTRSKVWYAPILLLMPVVMTLTWVILNLTGTPVPAPQIAVVPSLLLCVVFFISALGEELGWTGYATDLMQQQWGALVTGVGLGLFWAVYHYIALVQANRSISWIAGWTLGTVALRIIMVWLYNHTDRSLFAVALFHMTSNVTWQLFPINGSYYDPRISGVLLGILAVVIIFRSRVLMVRRATGTQS